MRYLGIVGHEAAKFTKAQEYGAIWLIRWLLEKRVGLRGDAVRDPVSVVSGHCPLGGVDIWAEQVADKLGIPKVIYPPKNMEWATGYKPRNLQIAERSEVVHVIVVAELPETYKGMRFPLCYHCKVAGHVKSGGCWTAIQAIKLGKQGRWWVLNREGIAAHGPEGWKDATTITAG